MGPTHLGRSVDDQHTWAWVALGDTGGGLVAGQQNSEVQCYIKALDIDNQDADSWLCLGYTGGGSVGGREYTASECESTALEIDSQCIEEYHNYCYACGVALSGLTQVPHFGCQHGRKIRIPQE